MQNCGKDLLEILRTVDGQLNDVSIFHLGLKLLDILELIHESGLVYNDLKPDNIMIAFDAKINSKINGK